MTPVTPSADDDPKPGRARDILRVGHACHSRTQHPAKLGQFGACVVAGDLLAGDDRDRSLHPSQRTHDRVRVTDRPVPADVQRASAADHGLLNIFGQQQHCRAAGVRRGDGGRQHRDDLRGVAHSFAEHRGLGEQRFGIQRAVASTGVLEATLSVHRGCRLTDQRQHRYPTGIRFAKSRNKIQRSPAGCRGDYAQTRTAAAVSVSHRRGGELMLGQHGRDVRPEIGGVVNVLDVGTVDAEDVFDSGPREMRDDVVYHPVLPRHTN